MKVKRSLDIEELYYWEMAHIKAFLVKELIFGNLATKIEEGVQCEFVISPQASKDYEDILIQLMEDALQENFQFLPHEVIENINNNWKLFTEEDINRIEFINKIKGDGKQYGKLSMTTDTLEKNTFLIYDYDKFEVGPMTVLPKIGMIEKGYTYPIISSKDDSGEETVYYEGSLVELASIDKMLDDAEGKALLLGCGIGYWAYKLAEIEKIESITIVEPDKDIIAIFENSVLPKITNKDKIKIINKNPSEYIDTVKDGDFDYLGASAWDLKVPQCSYLMVKLKTAKFEKTKIRYNDELHYISGLKNLIFFIIKEEILGNIDIEEAHKQIAQNSDDKNSYEYVKYFVLYDKEVYKAEDLSRYMSTDFIRSSLRGV